MAREIGPFFMFDLEYFNHKFLIGCDEVGRGPLAGPVVAAAVLCQHLEQMELLKNLGITDSKKITEKKRKLILEKLEIDLSQTKQVKEIFPGLSFCLWDISPAQIDEINILQASLLAMKKASENLINRNDIGTILIDGNKGFETVHEAIPIVKGDSKSLLIGLASIIAKQFRDEKMKQLDLEYPGYFFANHAGYPTKQHREAIEKIGVSPIHRKTFKGVKEFL